MPLSAETTYYSSTNIGPNTALDRMVQGGGGMASTPTTAVDFSFTKAAKVKISNWLCKNMSLRRRRETTPIRKNSIRVVDSKSPIPPPIRHPRSSAPLERTENDIETLSASVDFESEDNNEDNLVLTRNDFRFISKQRNS